MEGHNSWAAVFENPTILILLCGLGFTLVTLIIGRFIQAIREEKEYQDSIGKDN